LDAVKLVLTDFERTIARLFEDQSVEQEFLREVWMLCSGRGVPTRVLRTAGDSPYSLWTKAHRWMTKHEIPNPAQMTSHAERMYYAIDRIAIKYEMDAARRVRLLDDVMPVLKELVNAHIPVVIVSNNAKKAVELALQENNAEGLINWIVGREFKYWMLGNLKPKPKLLLEALERSRCDARTALLVGDSIDDMKAGKAAKIRFRVGLLQHSTFSERQLRRAGASLVLNRFGDLQNDEEVQHLLHGGDGSGHR
jgi:phosphoglycolate phosphatase-like HAD superfamily hydrolase